MKIVVAIDSLKGSLSSMEAGKAIKKGIENVMPAQVVVKPLADGGEGTMQALTEGLGGDIKTAEVMGPLGETVSASYCVIPSQGLAVIEMAEAAGITLAKEKNPLKATTYGVGQLILQVLEEGAHEIILGVGGSATNDGGVGMLQALGYEFYNKKGERLAPGNAALADIASISDHNKVTELTDCHIITACDVNNPLCGPNGATYIFGPQKGVTAEMLPILEKGMENWAKVAAGFLKKDFSQLEGTGAAGGLSFALKAFLGTELKSGIQLMLDTLRLEEEIKDADLVVTGEGRLDEQTAMGKGPIGVAKLAKKYGVKVIAFAGCTGDGVKLCNKEGIDAYFTIINQVLTLEDALDKKVAQKNMIDTVEQVFRLINLF